MSGAEFTIYKSTHPDVLAAIHARDVEYPAAIEKALKWANDKYPLPPKPADWPEYREWPERRTVYAYRRGGNFRVVGITAVRPIERENPPEGGWRYDVKSGELMPAKRTAAGKALVAELDSLAYTAPPMPGAPDTVITQERGQMYFCSWVPVLLGDTAWVKLSGQLDDDHGAQAIDSTIWAQSKASEYFAALEADQAKRAAA